MVRRYYNLPSLTSLAVFESCARHMNFKLAAEELNVTRGAISRQIKALEEEAGAPLFHRGSDGVVLTADGEALYAVLARGFSEASEALQRIRTGNRASPVTLGCTNAFATLWLMRYIGAFWRSHPDITIDHLISDDPSDMRKAQVDLRVRYGSGAWPDEMSELLFTERIYPVCGPEFDIPLNAEGEADLAQVTLLHVHGVDPEWTNWDEFLRRACVDLGPLPGRRINNFSVLMQATRDGQGVALGWDRLTGHLLEEGKLKRFGSLEIPAPGSYYLTWNKSHALSEPAQLLRDWLLETAMKVEP